MDSRAQSQQSSRTNQSGNGSNHTMGSGVGSFGGRKPLSLQEQESKLYREINLDTQYLAARIKEDRFHDIEVLETNKENGTEFQTTDRTNHLVYREKINDILDRENQMFNLRFKLRDEVDDLKTRTFIKPIKSCGVNTRSSYNIITMDKWFQNFGRPSDSSKQWKDWSSSIPGNSVQAIYNR